MPKHLRMAHKLWLAVILIVVMLVAVVGFAAYRSAKVQAHADAVSKDMESRVQAALRWSGLTETNAASLVVLDRSRGTTEPAPNCTAMPSGTEKTDCVLTVDEDKDIGHITTKPVTDDNDDMRATQITRMNDNRWAVVMGNGYNSVNQRPVLLIQYLDGDKKLLRLQTTTDATDSGKAADNGLGAPRLVDLNGDGRVDIAYAGDNLGNLWKFDLTSATASNWAVAFGGAPLFTASGPAALNGTTRPKVQPISTPPTVRANDRMKTVGTGTNAKNVRVGGMMVAFGTGRNVGRTDPESVDVQTLYSVLDNTRYREVGTGAAKRLEVHPGGGSCPNGADCVPTPAALGAGVTTAKLAQQVVEELSSGELGGIKPANADNELAACSLIIQKSIAATNSGMYARTRLRSGAVTFAERSITMK